MAYAVDNPKLSEEFGQFRKSLAEKQRLKPEQFLLDTWTKSKDVALRQDYLKHLERLLANEDFLWNEDERIRVIPMYRGSTEREAWQICEKGLSVCEKKSSFGCGYSFTSHLTYAANRAENVPGKGRVVLVALTIPGNIYPTTEGPKDATSLASQGVVPGFQSHYTCREKPCGVDYYSSSMIISQLSVFLFQ